jgi:hypothetical protein
MSKRSNAFQRLIKYIHEQIEPAGGTVTESACLLEKNIPSPIEREVDVLIEREVNSKKVLIAVECRDRSSKDDIQWIDELIGKYLNLPVNRVIAVSNSGFTNGAVKKAYANDIELRTLDEALSTVWSEEFTKLGIAYSSRSFNVEKVILDFSPPVHKKITPTDVIWYRGEKIGLMKNFIAICTGEHERKIILDYFYENFLNVFKTRADLKRDIIIEHKIPIKEYYIILPERNVHKIQSVTVRIKGTAQVKDIPVSFHDYQNARVTKGIIDIEGFDNIQKVFVAHIAGSKQGKVFVETKARKSSQ